MKTCVHTHRVIPAEIFFDWYGKGRSGANGRSGEKRRAARSYVCLHGVCFQCVRAGCEAVVAAASTHAAGLLKMAAPPDFHVWNNNCWLRPRKKSS